MLLAHQIRNHYALDNKTCRYILCENHLFSQDFSDIDLGFFFSWVKL